MNPRKTDSSEVFDMDKFRRDIKINMSPSRVGVAILLLLLLVLFIFGGPIYIVGPDEEGVIQTFGKYTSSNPPGSHFKFTRASRQRISGEKITDSNCRQVFLIGT